MSKSKNIKRVKDLYSKFPSLKKNKDNIKLLISYPAFQEEIKKARKFLEIPENGFKHDNKGSLNDWQDEMIKRSDAVISNPLFIQQRKDIWVKHRKNEIDYAMAKKQDRLISHKIPINYLTDICLFLTDKFNLPENYSAFIRGYILDNQIIVRTSNFSIIPLHENEKGRKVRHLIVEIYARLTDKDLLDFKRQTNEMIGNELPKYQELRDIDNKLTLENWVETRIKHDEVNNIDYKMTNGEIAENLFGNKNQSKKVNNTYRTIKKLRKSRFGKL